MHQTLRPKPAPPPPPAELPPFTPQTANTLMKNEKPTPNSGPVSMLFHLFPRRQSKPHKRTKKNTLSMMTSSPASKDQGSGGKSDTACVDSPIQESTPKRRQKQNQQEQEERKQSASSTPATPSSSHRAPLNGEDAADTDVATDEDAESEWETEIEKDAENASLQRQRREHWNGAHIGRDPYGLASKPYLDVGLPPPWERCGSCEEEMEWLRKKD